MSNMRAAKALANLSICSDLPEPSLLDDLISTKIYSENLYMNSVHIRLILYGPRCEKTCLQCFRTAKVQTSPASTPLLFAYWKITYLNLLQANFRFSS